MKTTLIIMRAALLASLSGLTAFAAAPLQAADRMTPGQWESTVMSDRGTYTTSACKTLDDVKIANADAKTARALTEKSVAGSCAIGTYEDSGNKVSYTMTCGKIVTTITSTFRGNSFESDFTNTEGGSVRPAMHVKGKRVGACK